MKKINVLPPTAKRVSLRTDPKINADIRKQTVKNINLYKSCNESDINERVSKLGQEWDTERFMELNAAAITIISSYLGVRTGRLWFLLTGAVAVFMLQHAFWGWCPVMPLIRKLGVRTIDEINNEKAALKLFRGDFKAGVTTAEEALTAVEK